MERVYLGDWLYNAGIVGLLKALGVERFEEGRAKDAEGKEIEGIRAEDNFVEIDREHFKDLARKYYKAAALKEISLIKQRLKRFKYINFFQKPEKLKELVEELRRLFKRYPSLKVELPKRISKKNLEEVREKVFKVYQELNELLNQFPTGAKDSEIEEIGKRWLNRGFFISKGGSQESKIHLKIENFENKIENLLTEEQNPYEIKIGRGKKAERLLVPCVTCQERASKGFLDTSLPQLTGLNKDAVNFVHFNSKFKDGLPICEICQAVFASTPLGLIPYSTGKFLFVNNSFTVEELFKDNALLAKKLYEGEENTILIDFFTEKVLQKEKEIALNSLLGITIIEVELGNFPKVKTIQLDRKKLELFEDENLVERLRKLSRAYLKDNKVSQSLLLQLIEKLLKKDLSTNFLFKLCKIYLQKDKRNNLTVNFSPNQINLINKTLLQAKQILEDKLREVSTRELNFLFREGKELRKAFKRRKNEKKADSIAFRLLSALKTGDTHKFMDVLIRTYTSVEREVPSAFVRNLNDEEAFKHCGYSFVSGLISSENAKESGGKNEQE